jgi:hypothetical protein
VAHLDVQSVIAHQACEHRRQVGIAAYDHQPTGVGDLCETVEYR